MHKAVCNFVLCVFVSLALSQAANAQNSPDAQARHIVVRMYELTVALSERCSLAPPEVATKFKSEMTRFLTTHEQFIKQVKQSPHYAYAEQNYRYDPAKETHTKDMLVSVCGYYADLIGAMVDQPRGLEEVTKMSKILSGQ